MGEGECTPGLGGGGEEGGKGERREGGKESEGRRERGGRIDAALSLQ